jgi:hypothetical protein
MSKSKKLNLEILNEQLTHLHNELKQAGAPKTAVRRVEDIAVSVKWLEDMFRERV